MDCDIDEDYMLFILNTLGQTYNSSSKFNADNFIIADMRDIKFINLMKEAFDKGYTIKNNKGRNLYDLSKIKDNDKLYFDLRFLEEKSKLHVIYDLVILKYPNDRKYSNITLSSLSKWDSINIEDILSATSKMLSDKNKVVVDFKYNKRNKYKKITKTDYHSIVLEPGIISQ
jgi:hypothetical protein